MKIFYWLHDLIDLPSPTYLTAQVIFASVAAWASAGWYWLNHLPPPVDVLVLMMMLDYITGVYAAHVNKTFSRKVGQEGLLKKLVLFVVVVTGWKISDMLGGYVLMASFITFGLVWIDAVSVRRNMINAKYEIPEEVNEMLEKAKRGLTPSGIIRKQEDDARQSEQPKRRMFDD